jgi:DNA-binding transcriptional ArsR family regulator
MVNSTAEKLDRVFHALADPTRREMIALLSRAERSVTELSEPFEMSLAAVSKHLRVLEDAGLVRREWSGRQARCRLNGQTLRLADDWLRRYRVFWEERLDALDALLAKRSRKEKK